jgi:hypothetical protein
MRWIALTTLLFGLAACTDSRERPCRIAVKSLALAPDNKAAGELVKVVSYGRYALPEIEQEYHYASTKGRMRYLDAMQRIKDAEAVRFLRVVVRWDDNDAVRRRAKEVADELSFNASR